MRILEINIQNFRKLLQCHIEFSEKTTLFVGANNSGKTSAMDALGKFLADRNFTFNDITISERSAINVIGERWIQKDCEEPTTITEWESLMPKMDIWLNVASNEMHYVACIIPTLKWRGGKLGVRLAFFPKDIVKLFTDYRDAYFAAREVEKAKENVEIRLYPINLSEFLEKNLNTYFSIKTYILDEAKEEQGNPQETPFEMECFIDNPLKKIIKVDMIDAQRGFTDPDNTDGTIRSKQQLSEQMRDYYEKHLDPEKLPSSEDLDILHAAEEARKAFDKNLVIKFRPAIQELEGLGYPGMADPKLTITTKMSMSETLKHDAAVQYTLSKNDTTLKLPEKYNGLGYQNLISMVFDLMRFRDDWMREGKAKQATRDSDRAIEPLHIVLIEEPEAHLHVQVQQVFIRKAYDVLTNHRFIKENSNFNTQLVISTHSSHIARETNFADLRYFKRLAEGPESIIATSKVINLSEVFGKNDETDKFVTRYLQATHCDLFFADAVILVEGAAENMLLPHFIRNKYPKLYQRYISILFKVGNRVDEVLADYSQDENEKITALRTALSAPFYELERYALYVSDNTRFATHQGVKGLEFPRVMVILDDAQARGFLFSYEKLFGVKAQSDTDEKNAHDGKDTSITRTARLFYVACTRAKKSLAIVAYTENEEMVRDTALANGWFLENEIYIV